MNLKDAKLGDRYYVYVDKFKNISSINLINKGGTSLIFTIVGFSSLNENMIIGFKTGEAYISYSKDNINDVDKASIKNLIKDINNYSYFYWWVNTSFIVACKAI